MRRPLHLLRVLLLVLLGIAPVMVGCGETPDRPYVISTFPVSGQLLPGGLKAVRVTYDGPVSILNVHDARMSNQFGPVPLAPVMFPFDPSSVYLLPPAGLTFPVGTSFSLVISQGLVVNRDQHYARDEVVIYFASAAASEAILASPVTNRVVLADPVTFVETTSTPTPGGRAPIGVLGSEILGHRRVWVQLADGAGAGHALAWFTPGDAAMTEVALTHVVDLSCPHAALAVSILGRTLYAAYRDEGLGRVRLCAIDVVTGAETASILLSPAASATTAPTGLASDVNGLALYVACEGAGGARLCLVDALSFLEMDTGPDPGVDGVVLASGGGPMIATVGRIAVAPLGALDSPLVTVDVPVDFLGPALPAVDHPSGPVGTNRCLTATLDGLFFVQGLAGGGNHRLLQRPVAVPSVVTPVLVSDDVGGVSTGANAVRSLTSYPGGGRFCAVLDSDVVAGFTWSVSDLLQIDADGVTPGVQCTALPPSAIGATAVGFFVGATPP